MKKWKDGRNPSKVVIPKGVTNIGTYRNLMAQVNKLALHIRQNAIPTGHRYYQAVDRFCRFLADIYRLEKFSNIADKHLVAYIQYLTAKKASPSTIKTDLAGIRFYHDQILKPRHIISSNAELNEKYQVYLKKRKFGGVDRTLSSDEFDSLLEKACSLKRYKIMYILFMCRYLGLRIHEAIRMDRATAENAIRSEKISIKGKGGLIRELPIGPEEIDLIREIVKNVPRGEKLFLKKDEKAHVVMRSVQQFIYRHRTQIEKTNRESRITAHGLRHTYVNDKVDIYLAQGYSEINARKKVSREIGHRRLDVIGIYRCRRGE